MLFINRLVMIGLLGVGITAATTAQAVVKLYTAEWYTESFGNECRGTALPQLTPDGAVAPHCQAITAPEWTLYENFAVPIGTFCNADNPRCDIDSTPTNGNAKWDPLGAFTPMDDPNTAVPFCAPISTFISSNAVRPAKGATLMTSMDFRIPPVYRNERFFTEDGAKSNRSCTVTSTGIWTSTQTRFGADKGIVQKGNPITGTGAAGATTGGFFLKAAPLTVPTTGTFSAMTGGIRTTGNQLGQVANDYPYIYSYTYGANFRNDKGVFGPGKGVGSFTRQYTLGTPLSIAASIMQTAGKNQFGGTMKMLGAMTTKVCYWLQAGGGGCSLGVMDWRYDAIGAEGYYYKAGMLTKGVEYTYATAYYNTRLSKPTPVTAFAERFPWTTGAVTITAVGRGPHKTVHYAQGYDNRNVTSGGEFTSLGKGTIQLVSPILTRWFGYTDYETGGIAVLRIKFVPEPQTWAILIAGVSLLGVGYRMRGR
jgi:hypothetical protein